MTHQNPARDQASELTIATNDMFAAKRPVLGAELLIRPVTPPRVLVVDDDPVFLQLMSRIAAKEHLDITCVKSLEEFHDLGNWNFDVAIIDYLLGPLTGIDLVRYMEQTAGSPPVILVSHTRQLEASVWPDSVRDFVHKALGPYAVLDAAYEAFEIDRIYKRMNVPKRPALNSNPKRNMSS